MARPRTVSFHDTQERLLAQIRDRLRNGELTERALAHQLGISQPHVNNVVRGRRKLSPEIADLMLNYFHVSLLDLYPECELQTHLERRAPDRGPEIEVLKTKIGPGQEWTTVREERCRYRSPCRINGLPESFIWARLLPDRRMPSIMRDSDIALLDTSDAARLTDCPSETFVVERGPDTLLRWIRGGFRTLYIADEESSNRPLEWEAMPMREDQRLDFVKGRVLWLGPETSLQRA